MRGASGPNRRRPARLPKSWRLRKSGGSLEALLSAGPTCPSFALLFSPPLDLLLQRTQELLELLAPAQCVEIAVPIELFDSLVALGERLSQQLDGAGGVLFAELVVAAGGGRRQGEHAGQIAERGGGGALGAGVRLGRGAGGLAEAGQGGGAGR